MKNPAKTTASARSPMRDLKLVMLATFFVSLGMGIYGTTFNNFAADSIHMSSSQLGILESLRESPGLAMAFMLALAMHIAEPTLTSAAFFIMALGFVGYARTNTFPPLVAYSVLWSVGLHCWMPLQSAMTLALSEEGHKAKRLGQVGAAGGLATAISLGVVMLVGTRISYSTWYWITAVMMVAAGLTVRSVRKDLSPPDKPRLVFKKKYSLYYALTFLEGCRKQVFITFAPWVLVKVYHTRVEIVALLMFINCMVNMFGGPIVGKLIDRRGESRVMTVSYFLLIFVFLGYALVSKTYLLFVFYCLDNMLYLSTIGLTSYINRIAEGNDIVPSLSMGVTTNHVGAVAIPIIGGLLWVRYGYQVVFFVGAAIVVASLILAARMRHKLVLQAE